MSAPPPPDPEEGPRWAADRGRAFASAAAGLRVFVTYESVAGPNDPGFEASTRVRRTFERLVREEAPAWTIGHPPNPAPAGRHLRVYVSEIRGPRRVDRRAPDPPTDLGPGFEGLARPAPEGFLATFLGTDYDRVFVAGLYEGDALVQDFGDRGVSAVHLQLDGALLFDLVHDAVYVPAEDWIEPREAGLAFVGASHPRLGTTARPAVVDVAYDDALLYRIMQHMVRRVS